MAPRRRAEEALGGLKVRGPWRGGSGYDHTVRELVRALARQGVAVQLLDLPEWRSPDLPLPPGDPWFESLGRPVAARVALQLCMPHLAHTEPEPVRALFSMFEATPVPHFWARLSAEHDLLVVPTESSRDAWVEGGFPAARIALCPLGVDPELFGSAALPLPLCTENGRPIDELATRFLNVSELSTRKNIEGLLRVWLRATTAADSAVLVLKLSQYAAGMVDALRRRLDEVERDAGRRSGGAAPVVLATDLLATEEMPRLYAMATHYISMSLGEGWDHPMMEAAASGLELIAPRHSAYVAYLDGQSATLIPTTPEPAGDAAGPDLHAFFRRATWWRPDEEAAAAAVRAAIDGHTAPRSPRDRILTEYTWSHSAARLRHLLGELAVSRAPRWPWPRPRPRTAR